MVCSARTRALTRTVSDAESSSPQGAATRGKTRQDATRPESQIAGILKAFAGKRLLQIFVALGHRFHPFRRANRLACRRPIWSSAKVLHRPRNRKAQIASGLQRPIRLPQEFASEQHDVRVF